MQKLSERVSVPLTRAQAQDLSVVAQFEQRSRSSIVREALALFLEDRFRSPSDPSLGGVA